MTTDDTQFSARAENSNDDDYGLIAPDGGDEPDADYPRLTEYQVQCLRDMITEAEFAYEEHPIEAWSDGATDAGERVEKAERDIFVYISRLLATREAEIARLKARQITPEMAALYQTHLEAVAEDERDGYVFAWKTDESLMRDLWGMFLKVMAGEAS